MTAEIMKLKPSEAYDFITAALKCGQVPYVAGPPALGKSQIVAQVAHDANAKMIDLRLSQILSEDMTGLPERNDKTGKAVYLPFETFPLEGDKIPDGYSGWMLFLDELSSASEEVLAAAYSLILDRMVGGKKLHKNVLVVAAGNRASDSAIARELPDTLVTRMLPIEVKANVKDWVNWAISDRAKGHESVVQFIQKHPQMLYEENKAGNCAELETFATPRGWEKVFAHMHFHDAETASIALKSEDSNGLPLDDEGASIPSAPISELVFRLIASAVGSNAARTFREEYDELIKIPYPWEVAQKPSTMRIPGNHVGKAKLMSDLSKYWLESDKTTQDAVISYINRVGGEYSELFMNQIKQGLGTKPSEMKKIEEVQKRLGIDPLLGTAPKGGGSDDDQIPF